MNHIGDNTNIENLCDNGNYHSRRVIDNVQPLRNNYIFDLEQNKAVARIRASCDIENNNLKWVVRNPGNFEILGTLLYERGGEFRPDIL